jgi:hypothetical protein
MFVELTRGHIDTSLSDSAKHRNEVGFFFRSAVKQLSGLDTNIAVIFCMICDRLLLFWDVSICERL